jgi:hypothetical protein
MSQANYDAFRPGLRVSSGSFDSVTTQMIKKIIDKLHDLTKFTRPHTQSQNYLMRPLSKVETRRGLLDSPPVYRYLRSKRMFLLGTPRGLCRLRNLSVIFRSLWIVTESKPPEETLKAPPQNKIIYRFRFLTLSKHDLHPSTLYRAEIFRAYWEWVTLASLKISAPYLVLWLDI